MNESRENSRGWLRDMVDFALDRDISEEIERQREILEDCPDWAEGHHNLGVLYYSQGLLDQSMHEFLLAMDCDPMYGPAYRRLGELYVRVGDYESAAKYAVLASERGDATLLDSFRRYPMLAKMLNEGVDHSALVELETIRRPASP